MSTIAAPPVDVKPTDLSDPSNSPDTSAEMTAARRCVRCGTERRGFTDAEWARMDGACPTCHDADNPLGLGRDIAAEAIRFGNRVASHMMRLSRALDEANAAHALMRESRDTWKHRADGAEERCRQLEAALRRHDDGSPIAVGDVVLRDGQYTFVLKSHVPDCLSLWIPELGCVGFPAAKIEEWHKAGTVIRLLQRPKAVQP